MAVLQRKDLEASPLADLHAIASELGLESFRTMRKADLIGGILTTQGGEEDSRTPAVEEPYPDEVPSDETLEGPSGVAEPDEGEPDGTDEVEDEAAEDTTVDTPEDVEQADEPEPPAEPLPAGEEEPEVVDDEESDEPIAGGLLDILANGSGFLRLAPGEQSREDVYVSPAQIRRC